MDREGQRKRKIEREGEKQRKRGRERKRKIEREGEKDRGLCLFEQINEFGQWSKRNKDHSTTHAHTS